MVENVGASLTAVTCTVLVTPSADTLLLLWPSFTFQVMVRLPVPGSSLLELKVMLLRAV